MSDGELVRQTLAGDRAGYEELVRRWTAHTLAVCHALVRCRHTAEEMAQEALLRGFRSLGTLEDHQRFGPWLAGIARRACLDWLKSKQSKQVSLGNITANGSADGLLASGDATPGTCAEHADDLRQLLCEVEALPEEYREVIMVYYYENVTYQELGAKLGVSAATVNARLTKARAMLRERLGSLRR